MATRASEDVGFRSALLTSTRALDVAVLAAVPALLLAVFALPASTRRSLVLAYESPTLTAMYASHFVHFSVPHLATNLAGYLFAVGPAYAYCALAGRRRDFFVTFAAVLFAFPFALSAVNVALVRPHVGYGFSGLAMAFLGFLPVALAAYASEHLAPAVGIDDSPVLFFAAAGVVAALAAPTTAMGAAALALAGVGVALYGASLWRRLDAAALRRAAGRAGYAEFALAGVLVVVLFPFVAFPQDVTVGGTVLNVYTHVVGYCLGFVAPYTTLRIGG